MNSLDVARVKAVFKAARLPVSPPSELNCERYIELMGVDKKNVDGKIRVILLEAIGKASLTINVDLAKLQETLNNYAG